MCIDEHVINSNGFNSRVDYLFHGCSIYLHVVSSLGVKIELGMGLVFPPRCPKIMHPRFHHVLATPHVTLFFSFVV